MTDGKNNQLTVYQAKMNVTKTEKCTILVIFDDMKVYENDQSYQKIHHIDFVDNKHVSVIHLSETLINPRDEILQSSDQVDRCPSTCTT